MSKTETYICGDCKGINHFREGPRGSGFVEALLYATLFFPGIFYSIWRRHQPKKVCQYCGSEFVLPHDSFHTHELLGTKPGHHS